MVQLILQCNIQKVVQGWIFLSNLNPWSLNVSIYDDELLVFQYSQAKLKVNVKQMSLWPNNACWRHCSVSTVVSCAGTDRGRKQSLPLPVHIILSAEWLHGRLGESVVTKKTKKLYLYSEVSSVYIIGGLTVYVWCRMLFCSNVATISCCLVLKSEVQNSFKTVWEEEIQKWDTSVHREFGIKLWIQQDGATAEINAGIYNPLMNELW